MFFFNLNTIIPCIISAVIGAGAVFLFFFLKNKGKKNPEDMKPSPKKEMLMGLRDNAETFSDLLEPLFILACGKTGRKDYVFDSWNERVNALEGYDGFKAVFAKKFGEVASWKGKKKKYIKNADKLLKYVMKAGIKRDEAETVKADEKTAEKYDIIGAASLQTDAEYDVFVPYWSIKTQVTDEEGNQTETETVLSKGAIR